MKGKKISGVWMAICGIVSLIVSLFLFSSGLFFNYYFFDPSSEGIIIALLFVSGLCFSLFGVNEATKPFNHR